MPIRFRRYFIREKYIIAPNKRLGFLGTFRYGLYGSKSERFDSQENISNVLHPQPVGGMHACGVCNVRYVCRVCDVRTGNL